jgi:hypothetical protein
MPAATLSFSARRTAARACVARTTGRGSFRLHRPRSAGRPRQLMPLHQTPSTVDPLKRFYSGKTYETTIGGKMKNEYENTLQPLYWPRSPPPGWPPPRMTPPTPPNPPTRRPDATNAPDDTPPPPTRHPSDQPRRFASHAGRHRTGADQRPGAQLPRCPLNAVLTYLSAKAGLIVVSDVSLQGKVSVVAQQPITTNDIVDAAQ